MGTVAPIPAGGAGNLPQIKPPTQGITLPNAGIPIQVPIGQAPVVQLPVGQTPNLHPEVIQAPKPGDVNAVNSAKKVEVVKQKIGELFLDTTNQKAIKELDYLMTHLNTKNVIAIEALLQKGISFITNSDSNHAVICRMLGNPTQSELFATFINNGASVIGAENLVKRSVGIIEDRLNLFKNQVIPQNDWSGNNSSSMVSLLKTIIKESYSYNRSWTNEDCIQLFDTILDSTCPFDELVSAKDIRLAEKLIKSPKLQLKGGFKKIPMLITHQEAYDSVIADLLKP